MVNKGNDQPTTAQRAISQQTSGPGPRKIESAQRALPITLRDGDAIALGVVLGSREAALGRSVRD